MHLLYARFWTKAMRDAGVLDLTEPFKALRHQGIMLAQGGWVDEATLRIDSQGGARVGAPDGAGRLRAPRVGPAVPPLSPGGPLRADRRARTAQRPGLGGVPRDPDVQVLAQRRLSR